MSFCKVLLFLCLITSYSVFSQNKKTTAYIDSVLVYGDKDFRKAGNYEKIIELNTTIVKYSTEINYPKGIAEANFTIGNCYNNLSKYKESLEYLEKAKQVIGYDDAIFNIKVQEEIAKNYSSIGIDQKAIETYLVLIEEISSLTNEPLKKAHLQYVYSCLATSYEKLQQYDLFYKNLCKANNLLKNPLNASKVAKYFIDYNKNIDSAAYYLNVAEKMINTGNFPIFQKMIYLRNKGKFYVETKEYLKAVDCYNESLSIAKITDRVEDQKVNYKLLYDVHKLMNNESEKSKYLEKYTILNDSLANENDKTVDATLNKLLVQKDVVNKDIHKTNTKLYITIFLILVIVGFIIRYAISQRKNNEEYKAEVNNLKEKSKRTTNSESSTSFKELLELATSNHPNFYVRFQEIHPDFQQNLLKINPTLQITELTLCAYIYLNFHSKEIAEYTFKSVKTIQNRKNSLRKRLNISSTEDIYVWMKSIA